MSSECAEVSVWQRQAEARGATDRLQADTLRKDEAGEDEVGGVAGFTASEPFGEGPSES